VPEARRGLGALRFGGSCHFRQLTQRHSHTLRAQNSTNVPLVCVMTLRRHITLSSNTHPYPHDSTTALWSSTEGPIHPSPHAEQPCYGTVRLPAQPPVMPMLHGDLIQCRYHLECTARPARGCCAAAASVQVPLTVHVPVEGGAEWTPPEAPLDWHPEVMEPKV
jgi:hypothetical protein